MMRKDKGLAVVAELLGHSNDRVIRAMSGALRNLAIDPVNRELLGEPFYNKKTNISFKVSGLCHVLMVAPCVVRSKCNTSTCSQPAQ